MKAALPHNPSDELAALTAGKKIQDLKMKTDMMTGSYHPLS